MAATRQEPITIDDERDSLFPPSDNPIYQRIFKGYEMQLGSFWVFGKFKWIEEKKNFSSLPLGVQNSLKVAFGFFTIADSLVEKYDDKILSMIKNIELQTCYGYQKMMERIHDITYNQAFIAMVPDAKERDTIKEQIRAGSAVNEMWSFIRTYLADTTKPLAVHLLAIGFIEGVMFSAIFAFIDWMKHMKYPMSDLYASNWEISRDEGQHQITAALAHLCLERRVTSEEFRSVVDAGLRVKYRFVEELIPASGFEGLTRDQMKLHVGHCANILGYTFGHKDLYNRSGTPLPWMAERSLNTKDNFFEVTPINYQTSGAMSKKITVDRYSNVRLDF